MRNTVGERDNDYGKREGRRGEEIDLPQGGVL